MSTPKRRREEDGQPRMSGTRTKMQLEIPPPATHARSPKKTRDRIGRNSPCTPSQEKKMCPAGSRASSPCPSAASTRWWRSGLDTGGLDLWPSAPRARHLTRERQAERKTSFFSFTCCEGVHDEAEPPTEVYIYIYTRAYGPRTPYAYGIRLEEMTGVPPTLGSVWSVQCGVGLSVMFFFSPSCCPMVGPTHQLRNDLSRPPVPAGKIPCNHQITAGIEYPARTQVLHILISSQYIMNST
jgi:hypothetical protein